MFFSPIVLFTLTRQFRPVRWCGHTCANISITCDACCLGHQAGQLHPTDLPTELSKVEKKTRPGKLKSLSLLCGSYRFSFSFLSEPLGVFKVSPVSEPLGVFQVSSIKDQMISHTSVFTCFRPGGHSDCISLPLILWCGIRRKKGRTFKDEAPKPSGY